MDFLFTTWEYILVFIMAATPWIEILIVIPVAVAAGLSAFWVTIIAFIGNALPVLLIVALYEKWEQWRLKRRTKAIEESTHATSETECLTSNELSIEQDSGELHSDVHPYEELPSEDQATVGPSQPEEPAAEEPSKRGKRARKIWDRYGLPGLALLAPAITGIHLAAVMALAFKSPKRATAIWMTISLALWAVATGVVSYYGLEWLDWIR